MPNQENPSTSDPTTQPLHPDTITITRRRDQSQQFNKYEYVQKHLHPIKQTLLNKYLSKHNEYILNILTSKLHCYQKYHSDLIQYYQCYNKVQQMVKNNFDKLYHQCNTINYKLNNCLSECSVNAKGNQQFIQCAQGNNGCFQKYHRIVDKLYTNMYSLILTAPNLQPHPLPPKQNKPN